MPNGDCRIAEAGIVLQAGIGFQLFYPAFRVFSAIFAIAAVPSVFFKLRRDIRKAASGLIIMPGRKVPAIVIPIPLLLLFRIHHQGFCGTHIEIGFMILFQFPYIPDCLK